MKIPDGDWRGLVVRSLAQGTILAVCVAGAMHVAHAWEGRSGVEARSFFTVAGTLAGVPASPTPTLRFTFHKAGETTPCAPIDAVMITYNGTTFSAQVPYEACGRGYFDGANITVDVAVNGTSVITGQAVNPVPYAQFASIAGTANVATQYGTPDCPVGYERATDTFFTLSSDRRLCQKSRMNGAMRVVYDEVVRVGAGASTFWIDRYEAGVWSNETATDVQFGTGQAGLDDYPSSFPDNGQWVTPLYALSRAEGGNTMPSIFPSRSLTWFQAQAACRVSGKRLPTSEEWFAAAHGTIDPGSNPGNPGPCRTAAGAPRQTGLARVTGIAETCVSRWGAEDMIGNVWEWNAEWFAGAGAITSVTMDSGGGRVGVGVLLSGIATPWPSNGFGTDGTFNVAAISESSGSIVGLPGAARRGGSYLGGTPNGLFALDLSGGPSQATPVAGFRCVIPR